MATPEAEETVAAPPTAESVVAEVVKTAESGEKEAPKAEEVPRNVEEPTPTEETPAEAPVEATEEALEAAPVEPSIPVFKEESNLVSDLKETEKKALEDFKARIVKAVADNEFKVPKKVVEKPKEVEVVETAKEVEAPAATTTAATEAAPVEAPAADTPAVETVATESHAAVTPATESPAVENPAVETPASETPAGEAPVTEPSASKALATEAPATEPPASEAPLEKVVETAKGIVEDVKVAVVEASTEGTGDEAVAAPVSTTDEEPAPAETAEAVSETLTKEAPVQGTAVATEETPAIEEEPEDLTPPEDVALWGVPLLHTKGDKRTDVILLKFLRARDFNVNLAFEQLKKTVIWRKQFKADSLLEEDFGTDLDEVAFNYGKDKEGHPVCYNVYGVFENKELYAKTFGDASKITNFLRWRIQVLEKGIKLLNFGPEGPNALVQIMDLMNSPGIPAKKELRTAYNQAVNILQDNYPEFVAKKVFINVPWYFSALFSFVSPFLSARTKSKFVVAPAGKTTEALLKFISAEHIPVSYGGLSKLNDPDFTGVEAPATELVIKAGEKTTIEIPITEVGGTVVWDLAVVGYEVSYGSEFVPSAEGAYTTIIEKPKKLPSTTEEPPRSSFKIAEPGKIVLSIDNSSRKKKIAFYRYAVKSTTAVEPELAG